ncbi:MAG TPA: DUF2958 domain-containing protein [Sphingobacteriaceae bacterium]
MKLFTEQQHQKLVENGHNRDQDHAPVVRLYLPFTNCQWLLSEIDSEEPDIAFGLCDLGMGFPELGNVSLEEIQGITVVPATITVDQQFRGNYPMSVYCCAARLNQEISIDEQHLQQCAQKLKKPKIQP